MRAKSVVCGVVMFGLVAGAAGGPLGAAGQIEPATAEESANEVQVAERLDAIVASVPTIAAEMKLRRRVAHATFCLPQNVLGILYYALLRATGCVVHTGEMNEVTIVVTGGVVGVSLGRYLFLPAAFLTEAAVRHEYGHTMQGYRHGPFYLLLEGTASFAQAAISIVCPSFAAGYFDRWPENEADELGGVP